MAVQAVARLLVTFAVLPFPARGAAPPLAAAASAALRDDDSAASVQLLQVRAQREKPLVFSKEATKLLKRSLPLTWTHIPKCGSSLANTFIHTPSLCPSLPPEVVINSTMFCSDCGKFNAGLLSNFRKAYPLEKYCHGSFTKWGTHEGVDSTYETKYRGHGVIMVRQPEQRVISSFIHKLHDWPGKKPKTKPAPSTYARVVQGCTVKTLTRSFNEKCGPALPTVSHHEVKLAKERLLTFPFVGLTDEWDLSICLFRVMFGGLCYGSDFEDERKAPGSKSPRKEAHSTDMLKGFVDKYDGELYEFAKEVFANNSRQYGVSDASCQPCYDHAAAHWTA